MKLLRASNFLEFWFALAIKDGIVNTNHKDYMTMVNYFGIVFNKFWIKAIDLAFILYAKLSHEVCLCVLNELFLLHYNQFYNELIPYLY